MTISNLTGKQNLIKDLRKTIDSFTQDRTILPDILKPYIAELYDNISKLYNVYDACKLFVDVIRSDLRDKSYDVTDVDLEYVDNVKRFMHKLDYYIGKYESVFKYNPSEIPEIVASIEGTQTKLI